MTLVYGSWNSQKKFQDLSGNRTHTSTTPVWQTSHDACIKHRAYKEPFISKRGHSPTWLLVFNIPTYMIESSTHAELYLHGAVQPVGKFIYL